MHFDDPNEGLSDLYFIEPRWLCALMARVITIRGHADLVKDGILELQDTKVMFKSDLPFDFYQQYVRLLVRFQIVYLLDASRILVPSKLPENEADVVKQLKLPYAPVRRVYKIDYQRIHGFWSRFMSRFLFYVKDMIAIDPTRYQKANDSEHGFFGHFCRSCLLVDISTSRKFSCLLNGVEWEVGARSEWSIKTSEESENLSAATIHTTSLNEPSINEPPAVSHSSKKGKNFFSKKGSTKTKSAVNGSSKKGSSKKNPSRNRSWMNKKLTVKESPPNNDVTKSGEPDISVCSLPQHNNFPKNVPATSPAMFCDSNTSGDDFQALLLDPNVKVFSYDDLHDETDVDDHRIVINQVDTAMDYSRR